MAPAHLHGDEGQPGSVEYITKHNSEQKWERYAGENGWIDFLVRWHTICIDNFLEDPSEFIQSKVCRLHQAFDFVWALLIGQTIQIQLAKFLLNFKIFRDPNKPISDSLTVLEHIKMLINSSFFEDEELIDFDNTHISTASCVGTLEVVSKHSFGLSNDISGVFFLLLLFSNLKVDSIQGYLKHGA